MFIIEGIKSSPKDLWTHIEKFEDYCVGKIYIIPSLFRKINKDLSVNAVLLIGEHRYREKDDGTHILWRGLDKNEHDLGLVNDAHVMRDYPGFHTSRSHALGRHYVVSDIIEEIDGRRGTYTMVTLTDGSTGIGPNFNFALRNASIKMHLKQNFNKISLSHYWNSLWGNA